MKNIFREFTQKIKFLSLKIINLLYLIYKIVIKKVAIGWLYLEKIMIFSYLIVLVLVIYLKIYIRFTKITILLQIYIYRIQDINSNLCGLFSVLFCLYKVDSKNKFISFLNLFNSNNFLKNELI